MLDIFACSKKGQNVLGILLSNSDQLSIKFQLKLFDILLKPVLQYGCEIWRPELMSYKTDLDKCQIEQMHLKFCKRVLSVPWYAPNIGCRTELGRLPLSLEIKTVIYSYMTRLSCDITNPVLSKAAKYAITRSTNFNNICQQIKSETQMEVSDEANSEYEMKRTRGNRLKKLQGSYGSWKTWKVMEF